MTRAREVLADCELALTDFEAAGPTPYWRTRWTGLVALLRMVGHVLDKVDAKQSTSFKEAIRDAWEDLKTSKPEPRIFWAFIDEERNNVLKAYKVGARLNSTFRPGAAHLSLSGESQQGPSGPTTYESFIRSGVFDGRDAVDVCRDAITFWKDFLDKVDAGAKAKSGSAV